LRPPLPIAESCLGTAPFRNGGTRKSFHQQCPLPESRMRETRPSGSEVRGTEPNRPSLPLS
jgi:hypothetical protein